MITVNRTATIRQTSQAGKKEPRILKDGARAQLVNNSTPSASVVVPARVVKGLRKVLMILRKLFASCLLCIVRTRLVAQVQGCDINQSGLNPDNYRQVWKRYDAGFRYCCGNS